MKRWSRICCALLAAGLLIGLRVSGLSPVGAQTAWVVTTTANAGPGSLREALIAAPVGATITFDPDVFPLDDPAVIAIEGERLQIAQGDITLDATGAGVVLDGQFADGDVLSVISDRNVIQGLIITGAPGIGIFLEDASDNVIGGMNDSPGVGCRGACNHLYSLGQGIDIRGERASGNIVSGNLLGTDATGTAARPFAMEAVLLSDGAHDNVIGGSSPAERNVISGGGEGPGIVIEGLGTNGNRVVGNFIGTDVSGTAIIGNWDGVSIRGDASGNVIGGGNPLDAGSCTGECNLISGNHFEGIWVGDGNCRDNVIQGNFIGTDISGTRPLGNGANGIIVTFGAGGTRIEANLISANGSGVVLERGAGGDVVMGNLIGVDITGTDPLGNVDQGVCIADGNVGAVIGPDNVIAHNGGFGILVDPMGSAGAMPVHLTRNLVYANGGRLALAQNVESWLPQGKRVPPPKITESGAVAVSGYAQVPGAIVEIYSGDRPGELRTYEGMVTATADGSFTLALPSGRLHGEWVTALLTEAAGSVKATSMPAAPVKVGGPLLLMPLPGAATLRTVSLDPARVGINFALALVSVLYFGFTSTVCNNILESHAEDINRRLDRWLPRAIRRRLGRTVTRSVSVDSGRKWWPIWLLILAASALIESFLVPGPVFSADRLGTFLSLLLASCALGVVQLLVELRVRRSLTPEVTTLFEPQALGLAMAVGAVMLSRVLRFQPGYIYGIVGALAILPELETGVGAGRRALWVLAAIFGVGVLAWLVEPLAAYLSADFAALLETILLVSLQTVFFALLPLSLTDGGDLVAWNWRVWGGCGLVVGFLFFHIVMNPGFEDVQLLQANTLFTVLSLYALWGLVTLALWLTFGRAEGAGSA